ncbi:MAG: hypothetical protein ABIB43_03165 [archaeon]
MNFKKLGYSTGKVLFPGIDIVVNLGSNQYFRNDGVVEDFDLQIDKIYSEGGLSSLRKESYNSCASLHVWNTVSYNRKFTELSNVFWKKSSAKITTFVSGHESTHAVIRFKKEEYLLNELKKYGFALNPFESYTDVEDIADVGGFLGLYKKGFSLSDVSDSDTEGIRKDLLKSQKLDFRYCPGLKSFKFYNDSQCRVQVT